MRITYVLSIIVAVVLMSGGCGGSETAPSLPNTGRPEMQAPAQNWPAGLPVDSVRPWEPLDNSGYVVPAGRTANCINAESTFCSGVERDTASAAGVSDNGEAARLSSGDAGSGGLSWAWWRLELGGEQPGAVSADVNLLPMNDGAQSAYYIGLSDYGAGCWQWHGPFGESHVRLSTAADLAAGSDFLSEYGNLFICLVASDGATFDVVGVAANAHDSGDSEAPAAPTGLTATAVAGGVQLSWDEVSATDLAGYRVYYSSGWFFDASATGVRVLPCLEGLTHCTLAAVAETHVRVGAVDISGNESLLSEIVSATPLAGAMPDVRLTASAPSGLVSEAITLTASGADEYDWDLDGDGFFELTGLAAAVQDVDTSRAGFIRPMVRGLTEGGSCGACGGVSVLIGTNSRPLATVEADPTSGSAPLEVTFTGTGEDSDGTIAQYSWDFDGDGTYDYTHATEPNPPVETYDTPGMYNARFRVEDDLGLFDVDTVGIFVSAPLNVPPTADLTIGNGEEAGNPPHTVDFDAGGSTDTDGTIIEYLWDFEGDGDYDDWTDTATISHEYTVGGSYDPVVCVIDDGYARDTATVNIAVNIMPVADLTADVTEGPEPLAVSFDGTSSTDADGTIVNYEWDLDGDGLFNETGAEADAQGGDTASLTYNFVGYYDVQLRVTDNDSGTDTALLPIKVRGWTTLTLDNEGRAGYDESSLRVVDGCPAISYTEDNDDDLKFIRATTANGVQVSDWSIKVTIDSTDDVGRDSSLAVVDGYPAISYSDRTYQNLKYVRATDATGSAWGTPITVEDSVPDDGLDTWLVVVSGFPAICYKDWTNGSLKYVRANDATGTSWSTPLTVASGTPYDMVMLMVNSNPAISYFNSASDDLMYVRATDSNGSAWGTPVTVDSAGDVGHDTAMVIADGRPAISYIDANPNYDLKYVRASDADGSTWGTPQVVDSASKVWQGGSMAIVDGRPAIAYPDNADGVQDLMFVWALDAAGSTWDTPEVVDGATIYISYCISIAEVDGRPAISYYDNTNYDLKYAIKY